MLAQFVVAGHMRCHPDLSSDERTSLDKTFSQNELLAAIRKHEPIAPPLLRSYIAFARAKFHPRLTQVDEEKLVRVYTDLRREAAATGSVAITVRHVESLIRCAEASARLHLRNYVSVSDIDLAIRVVLESFLQTQKLAILRSMRRVSALSHCDLNSNLLY